MEKKTWIWIAVIVIVILLLFGLSGKKSTSEKSVKKAGSTTPSTEAAANGTSQGTSQNAAAQDALYDESGLAAQSIDDSLAFSDESLVGEPAE